MLKYRKSSPLIWPCNIALVYLPMTTITLYEKYVMRNFIIILHNTIFHGKVDVKNTFEYSHNLVPNSSNYVVRINSCKCIHMTWTIKWKNTTKRIDFNYITEVIDIWWLQCIIIWLLINLNINLSLCTKLNFLPCQ